MPHWRVSETLPAEIGQFDLVIIDEASQSDLWALPCLLRGRRLLIVGDDHQVSPQGAGLSEQRIAELHERFLSAQVYGEQMTPEKSIYDLARVAFAGQTVMLQEHFRCARAIIEFSKRESYSHDLQPLRVPKMTERLDPPLVDIYVSGAQQHGNINEAEARVLVGEIARLLADPHCAGRSIGVVSILGPEQARRIFDLVRENIPAREIIARSITVGDARTFQGKERDIMLLSMVVAPGSQEIAIGAMSEQRFNVAATRARDRMVLVRSLAPEDLEDPDLRLRLIRHFASPFGAAIDARPAEQRARLTSPFERALYDDLSSRGYRVLAKVSAGNDQIDLVVEGGRDQRLAIECDGDGYAGRELWAAAMARQRVLERAGWQFWRAFGASFVLHPKQVLENLLATLARLGIEPAGAPDASVAPLTEHRRVEADTVLRPGRAAAPSSVPSKH
jgi:very-short-patch-repair endonuclease